MSTGAIPRHETRSASEVQAQLRGLHDSCVQDPSGDRTGYQGRNAPERKVTGELGGVPIWDASKTAAAQNDIYASPGDQVPDISLKDAVQLLGLDGPHAPTDEQMAFRLGQHFCTAPEFADLRKYLGNFAKAGIAAGVSMAAAHKVEVELLERFATNPVMRSIAVSWPYVFLVVGEAIIKSVLNYEHPDPGGKVKPPVAPGMVGAAVNWNHIQNMIAKLLEGNKHLNAVKISASALIATIRGMVDHGVILRAIAMLENPEDAPQVYRPLSVQETVLVNVLVVLLRNLGADILRQIKNSITQQIKGDQALQPYIDQKAINALTDSLPKQPSTVLETVVYHPYYAGGAPMILGPVGTLAKMGAGEPTQREDDPTVQGNAEHGLNPQSAFNPFS